MNFLKGGKTYILGVLGIVWAIYGWVMGHIDPATAQGIVWAALTTMAIRAGIKKAEK